MLRWGWLLGVVDLIGTGMEVYAVSTEEQLATPAVSDTQLLCMLPVFLGFYPVLTGTAGPVIGACAQS